MSAKGSAGREKGTFSHRGLRTYMGWREPPYGTGEASVLVVPLDGASLTTSQLEELQKILTASHFSEETISFRILELDLELRP